MNGHPKPKWWAKALFAAMPLLLYVQFHYAWHVREFYPAFLFPLFGGIDGVDGIYENLQNDVIVTFPNDTLVYSKQEFLRHLPESHRYKVMYLLFSPGNPIISSRFDEPAAANLQNDPEFMGWLRGNLAELSGRDDAQKLEIQWYSVLYDTNQKPTKMSRHGLGSITYPL